ncbi:MAG: hypothetical protein ACK5QW_06720 [Cyanobacteriota bacterium]
MLQIAQQQQVFQPGKPPQKGLQRPVHPRAWRACHWVCASRPWIPRQLLSHGVPYRRRVARTGWLASVGFVPPLTLASAFSEASRWTRSVLRLPPFALGAGAVLIR